MTPPELTHVRYTVRNGVATLALDHPDNRNALSAAMLDDLLAGVAHAKTDADVRCLVIASAHPTVFSSGGNLAGFREPLPLVRRLWASDRLPRLIVALGELGKPSICAANGHVLAGALGLALACDLIIAKEGTTFGTPEINVGLFPFVIMALIYRNVGRKRTNELLLLGERITAEEAERIGLINRVAPASEFQSVVEDWAQRLAAKSPVLMRLGKDAMFRQQDMGLADALEYLRHNLTLAFSTDDIQEGVQAFLEKRAPNWSGG